MRRCCQRRRSSSRGGIDPATTPEGKPNGVTLWQACDEWLKLRALQERERNTRSANESPVVKHLLPFFAHTDRGRSIERLVTEVDESLVTAFIEHKRAEREILADIAEKLDEATDDERLDFEALKSSETADFEPLELELVALRPARRPPPALDPVGHGRISLSTRGLSDSQINLCMSRLSSILDRAARKHGLQIPDPTIDLRLRISQPTRNWLWPMHLEVLAAAARELRQQRRSLRPQRARGCGVGSGPVRATGARAGLRLAASLPGDAGQTLENRRWRTNDPGSGHRPPCTSAPSRAAQRPTCGHADLADRDRPSDAAARVSQQAAPGSASGGRRATVGKR